MIPARRKRCSGKKPKGSKQPLDAVTASSRACASKGMGTCSLEICEVMSAIESLYDDELKPFGRILRKRVAERIAQKDAVTWVPGSDENLPIVGIADLLGICEGSDRTLVEPEAGGDWCALLLDRSQSFVNVYCPNDIYPSSMWEAFEQYLLIGSDNMSLPGGRYACAQVLGSRGLSFLHGRSLGQLCHIVQLAISRKRLLGYLNGAIVPYVNSQSMVKEQCAMHAQPFTIPNQPVGETRMADLETARRCIRTLLNNAASENDGVGTVPLSNVKRFLKSKFDIELSETKLGYAKLSDLLQDIKFSDICTVKLQKHGYIVVQVPSSAPSACSEINGKEPRHVEAHSKEEAPRICGFDEPLSLDFQEMSSQIEPTSFLPSSLLAQNAFLGDLVQHSFIHVSRPSPSPIMARRRSSSIPKDYGSQRQGCEADYDSECPCHSDATESTVDSITESGTGLACVSEDIAALSSPSPFVCRRHHALDYYCKREGSPRVRHVWLHSSDGVPDVTNVCEKGLRCSGRADLCDPAVPASFRINSFASSGISQHLKASSPTRRKHSFPSPSRFGKEGCVGSISLTRIRNTFIDSPKRPPTPIHIGAARRAQSLPKDLGSTRNHWEATCQSLGFSYTEKNQCGELESSYSWGWGPTPNMFNNPKGLCSLATSPACVANPLTLTSSPNDRQILSSKPEKVQLRLATGSCPLIDQSCTKPSSHQRIICLAELVE